jgi:uncharacterized protein (TIGR02217 family)
MTFLENPRFPDKIAYGSTFVPTFSTTIVETGSGFEQRNRNWEMPRYRFEVGMGIKTLADYYELLDFFYAVGGMAYGFRFKNWMDYKSCQPNKIISPLDQLIGVGDGITKQFQLKKTYIKGLLTTERLISKPIQNTVKIAIGYQTISGWQVDTASGIITFEIPPPKHANITAGFEYDTPCRFDSDELSITIEKINLGGLSIVLKELKF